ncbi:MAG: SMI1/KNR4 family protein [Bacteroidota bacterium]
MTKLWTSFRNWIKQHTPSLLEELEDAASQWDIKEAEEELETTFPDDLKQFLMEHNGGQVSNGLIGNWDLLSLDEMVEASFDMDEHVEDGDFGSNQRPESPEVKGMWWNPNWIPFASSTNGHFLCLDMDPAEKGSSGQVIAYFYDSGERPVLANSLKDWFEHTIKALEEGKITANWSEELKEWRFSHPGFLLFED